MVWSLSWLLKYKGDEGHRNKGGCDIVIDKKYMCGHSDDQIYMRNI